MLPVTNCGFKNLNRIQYSKSQEVMWASEDTRCQTSILQDFQVYWRKFPPTVLEKYKIPGELLLFYWLHFWSRYFERGLLLAVRAKYNVFVFTSITFRVEGDMWHF
jgi:hypothetical protein